jgi:hypothetical protein
MNVQPTDATAWPPRRAQSSSDIDYTLHTAECSTECEEQAPKPMPLAARAFWFAYAAGSLALLGHIVYRIFT